MPKVAIIKGREVASYDRYDDYTSYQRIVEHITDWEEVTDEEVDILRRMAPMKDFTLVEHVEFPRQVINKTVSEYLADVKAEKARQEAEKKKRADAALQRKLKKEAKDRESKLALFKKLQEELGAEAK